MASKKLLFIFAGTGDSALNLAEKDTTLYQHDVIRVYVNGCQDACVGNGYVNSDLTIAASNIQKAFNQGVVNLASLQKNFENRLIILGAEGVSNDVQVSQLTLSGFSRGAVTIFAVAKALDNQGIPMHIVADQPVSGEKFCKSLYESTYDLTRCQNLKTVHTLLASHDQEQSVFHNHYFSQMVARFPAHSESKLIGLPFQNHLTSLQNLLTLRHKAKIMSEQGLTQSETEKELEDIESWYKSNHNKFSYTPPEFRQPIFGLDQEFPIDEHY